MRRKLTPAFVKEPELPSTKSVIYWDTAQPGFGLAVTRSGQTSYVYQYRTDGGRRGRTRRGTIASTLSLADAKKEAKKIAGDAAKGLDPLAHRSRANKNASERTTVKAILEDYLVKKCGMTRDTNGVATFSGIKRTAHRYLTTYEQHIWPKIGDLQIKALTRSRITAMLDEVEITAGPCAADVALKS